MVDEKIAVKKRGRPKKSDIKRVHSSLLEKTLAGKDYGYTAFDPTPWQKQKVIEAKAAGISDEQIAYLIRWPDDTPITIETLHKAFWDELNRGFIDYKITLSNILLEQAKSGSTSAVIFALKCRAGWREPRDEDKDAQRENARLIAEAIEAVLKPVHE